MVESPDSHGTVRIGIGDPFKKAGNNLPLPVFRGRAVVVSSACVCVTNYGVCDPCVLVILVRVRRVCCSFSPQAPGSHGV